MTDYTGYQYQNLVDEITELFEGVDGWGDAYQSSMGQTLIQLLADTTDSLHYIQERRVRESYLETAQLRSSILALAGTMSYRPRRKISSKGRMKIRLIDDDGNTVTPHGNVFIPARTEIYYLDNFTFITLEDILITPLTTEIEFDVVEGKPASMTVDPATDIRLANNNYILMSNFDDVENELFTVFDSDGEWKDVRQSYDAPPVGALSFLGADDRYYDIVPSVGGMRVIFGDDNFGKKPNNHITVQWIRSSGSAVSIEKVGVDDFVFENNVLRDDIVVVPRNEYEYEITNITPITGGLDEESLEDIKIGASEYNKTGGRAVTPNDYNHAVLRSGIGGIVDFNAYGESELGLNLFRMNHIFGSYLTITGERLTQEQEQQLRDYVENLAVAIPHISFFPADNIQYQYNLRIRKHPSNRLSNFEVYKFVRDEITGRFDLTERRMIGRPIYHSEMWEFINRLVMVRDGVEFKVAQYIDLDVNPVYTFSTPMIKSRTTVTFKNGSVGDTYKLTISGVEYEYTLGSGETKSNAISYFETELSENFFVTVDGDDLNIEAPADETYTISSGGSSHGVLSIEHVVRLPPRLLNNRFNEDMILRGSLEVLDESYDQILYDDGDGNLRDSSSDSIVGSIDYITNELSMDLLPDGTYFIRYQEDEFKNIKPNERTYVSVLQPKDTYDEVEESLSTIEFV